MLNYKQLALKQLFFLFMLKKNTLMFDDSFKNKICAIGRDSLKIFGNKIVNVKKRSCLFDVEVKELKHYFKFLSEVLGKNLKKEIIRDEDIDIILSHLYHIKNIIRIFKNSLESQNDMSNEDINHLKILLKYSEDKNKKSIDRDDLKNMMLKVNYSIKYLSNMKKSLYRENNIIKSYESWLNSNFIENVMEQLDFNCNQKKIMYKFMGVGTYDEYEYSMNELRPPNSDKLNPDNIINLLLSLGEEKNKLYTLHYVMNTCCVYSTGQHFLAMIIQKYNKEIFISYFDSQRTKGPYRKDESPPDNNIVYSQVPPIYRNKFINYKSKFYDWYEMLENKIKEKTQYILKTPSQPFYNTIIYQKDNHSCGIYSMFIGYLASTMSQPFKSSLDLNKIDNIFIEYAKNKSYDDTMAVFIESISIEEK